MTIPLYVRYIFFALGLLLVIIDGNSVVGTLIVPRPAGGRLMVWVDRVNHAWFGLLTAPIRDFRRRDRMLAAGAATLLVFQLVAWLAVAYLGFTLMLWPFVPTFTDALDTAGPALWFIGDSSVRGWGERLGQDAAAVSGPVFRPGARNCWPGRTTRWAPGSPPSARCPTSTSSGNAGRLTSRRATPP